MEAQRALLRRMDESHRQKHPGQPDLDARIANYELAARMQITATDALDLSQESEQTKEMYGLNQETNCFLWKTLSDGKTSGRTRCSLCPDLH